MGSTGERESLKLWERRDIGHLEKGSRALPCEEGASYAVCNKI
jgi:hypothetical protein